MDSEAEMSNEPSQEKRHLSPCGRSLFLAPNGVLDAHRLSNQYDFDAFLINGHLTINNHRVSADPPLVVAINAFTGFHTGHFIRPS
jgi:hypothetical protein